MFNTSKAILLSITPFDRVVQLRQSMLQKVGTEMILVKYQRIPTLRNRYRNEQLVIIALNFEEVKQ